MTEEKEGGGPLGVWTSTVRVSSEVVRSNAVPVLIRWAEDLRRELGDEASGGGVLAMRQMETFVATGDGADLLALELEDFVQVMEYDPVRHVALVVGLRDAPQQVPLLWLMLRVFPGADGVVVLPHHSAAEPQEVRPAPRGSFEAAFAVGELMAGSGREGVLGPASATIEGVGTVLVVPPKGDPAQVLGGEGEGNRA